VTRRDNYAAQRATKRALEAIHELEDSREKQRREWSSSGWSPFEVEVWRAHVGARNIAHHQSTGIVSLHGLGNPDDWLNWSIDPAAVAKLKARSEQQANAYRTTWTGSLSSGTGQRRREDSSGRHVGVRDHLW